MKQFYPTVFLVFGLVSCQQKQADTNTKLADSLVSKASLMQSTSETPGPSPNNFLIIPGLQVGAINANATEASLIALLGKENVVRDTIYVAEGNYEIGTTLFRNTADQAQIFWSDKRHFAHPETVTLRPAYDQDGKLLPGTAGFVTQWITDKGLKLGMSLQDVEKLNGRAFNLYGFEWDYGGLSSGWKGGSLEEKDGETFIGLGFGVSESLTGKQEKLYESLMGDQEFLSSNPAMHTLNPTVQNMTISFK